LTDKKTELNKPLGGEPPAETTYQRVLRFFGSPLSSDPGSIAHPDHSVDRMARQRIAELRSASVLIPITREQRGMQSEIVLTVRAAHLKSHAGQISLPGGTTEEEDHDAVATALRESEEEIGLKADQVEVIGKLGDMALPSGFHITPIVGLIEPGIEYVACPDEVAEIFHAPLALVLDPGAYSRATVAYADSNRTILELQHERYRIWGATAAILYDLATQIKRLR